MGHSQIFNEKTPSGLGDPDGARQGLSPMTLSKRQSRWYRFAAAEQSNVGIFVGICRARLPQHRPRWNTGRTNAHRRFKSRPPTKNPDQVSLAGPRMEFPPEKGISARSLFQRVVDV